MLSMTMLDVVEILVLLSGLVFIFGGFTVIVRWAGWL